jgi:hypothetical protein
MLAMRNFTSDLIAVTEQLPPAAAGLLAPSCSARPHDVSRWWRIADALFVRLLP